jgi:hypothetical protein
MAAAVVDAEVQGLDTISLFLLNFIKVTLDDNGAWEWNLRVVAVVSAVVLAAIKFVFHKAYGIDWFSLTNAIVTGFGAAAIVYLNTFASEAMTGVAGTSTRGKCCNTAVCTYSQQLRHPRLPFNAD